MGIEMFIEEETRNGLARRTSEARDIAWCERNLGDVPYRSMTLTRNVAPATWAEVAGAMQVPSGEAASEAWAGLALRD